MSHEINMVQDHTESVLLTIGIPTYNGSAGILDTLDSVIQQIPGELESRVDILVSDNASTDDTEKIVRDYMETRSARIHYFRNDKNVGFDRNVDMLFKKASGKYVWMLADDDVLADGALLHIVNLLDQYPDLKAVQVNYDKYDLKLERIVHQVIIPEDLYCRDAETFLVNSKGRYGAVSTLIIDRDAWNSEDLSDGVGTAVLHMFGLLKILLKGDSYIAHQPLVKVREGSTKSVTNGDSLLRVALSSGTLFHCMKKMGYGSRIIRWHLRMDRRYAYNAILLAKLRGIKNRSAAVKKLIAVHNSLELWLIWIPFILLPDFLIPKGAIRNAIVLLKRVRAYIGAA
jgi:glycosyltransferase involved in cell wall biosynthesis